MVALRHQTPEFTPQILQRAPDGALLVVGGVTRSIPSSALPCFSNFSFSSNEQPTLMRRSAVVRRPMDARVHRRSAVALWLGQYAGCRRGGSCERDAFSLLTGFGAATLALSGFGLWCLGAAAPCHALYHRRLLQSDGGGKSAVGRRPHWRRSAAWRLFWGCGARWRYWRGEFGWGGYCSAVEWSAARRCW